METIDCPKCEYEHNPCGSHEEDYGQWECDQCGFSFSVEIDYEPSYTTACVTHEWGEFEIRASRGRDVECRFCIHCQKCELRPLHS